LDGRTPLLVFDQEEKALVKELNLVQDSVLYFSIYVILDATRLAFTETLIVGDSGNPLFIIINEAPVLVSVGSSPGAGAWVSDYKTAITTAISTLSVDVPLSEGVTWEEVAFYDTVDKANIRGLSSSPMQLPPYTVAGVPSAARYRGCLIFVNDGTSNKRLAVSDGVNWRWPDGNIIS
jgi:hypothetical protein